MKHMLKKLAFGAFILGFTILPGSAAASMRTISKDSSFGGKERVIIFGGLVQQQHPFRNDVWSSGGSLSTWSEILAHDETPGTNQFEDRAYFAYTYFKGSVWIINGNDSPLSSGGFDDVWSSTDGITWIRRIVHAPWEKGVGSTLTVFKNKMWLIGGGEHSSGAGNGVWSSSDGIAWNQVATVADSDCLARSMHQTVVFQDKLWIIGNAQGVNSIGADICSSSDGIHWNIETPYAPWGTKTFLSAFSYNGKLWIIGGYTSPYVFAPNVPSNDVWSSPDGVTWTREVLHAPWQARQGHVGFIYDNKMWVAGGHGVTGSFLNDVWSSVDGINWTQATSSADWGARSYFGAVVIPQKVQPQKIRSQSKTVSKPIRVFDTTRTAPTKSEAVKTSTKRVYSNSVSEKASITTRSLQKITD